MRQKILILLTISLLGTQNIFAAETDILTDILKKVDSYICTSPHKIKQFYGPDLIIMEGDRRASLAHRIEDYERMIAEYDGMKCNFNRKVLAGEVGEKLGYVLVDETINVKIRLSGDERQHNFCSYIFTKKGDIWKISQEHCSSLPDYSLLPGEDGLYYFHNPIP